jgi:hypothetical protein
MGQTLAQTYVWHGDKAFFVSTINRESSAVHAHGMVYSETMAWEWDAVTKQRGKLVRQDEDGKDLLRTHFAVVKSLHDTGAPIPPEEV